MVNQILTAKTLESSESMSFFGWILNVSNSLLSGVELLKKFKEEFANFEKERQELANAEKLFGLSITLYPELLEMEKELKGLDQIFSIYENQKVRKFISQ